MRRLNGGLLAGIESIVEASCKELCELSGSSSCDFVWLWIQRLASRTSEAHSECSQFLSFVTLLDKDVLWIFA